MYWSLPSGRSRLSRSSAYLRLRASLSITVIDEQSTQDLTARSSGPPSSGATAIGHDALPADREGTEDGMADEELAPIGERVLFENEHVRVWENVVEPGEESPIHR